MGSSSGGSSTGSRTSASPYRVFVSYSHEDRDLVGGVVRILRDRGLRPLWDEQFQFGHGFDEQIRSFIAHAHVFLSVITESSSRRGWVHQEIGYGLALNVPVLPLAVGSLPGQMLQTLHAVQVGGGPEGLEHLGRTLTPEVFDRLVERARGAGLSLYQCAAAQEERMLLMERHARDVLRMGFRGHVRARQSLTVFGTPDKPANHPVWRDYYGDHPRGQYYIDLIRAERLALAEHAGAAGCSLILNPARVVAQYPPAVAAARLKCLAAFLEAMPDDQVRVALDTRPDRGGSTMLVGDWFAAEAVLGSQGAGYFQTIFTRHAPSLQKRVDEFDTEMAWLLEEAGWGPGESRGKALEEVRRIMGGL